MISEFMCGNGLKLNGDKTHIIHFSTDTIRSTNVQLNTGNEVISVSQSEKLLGGVVSMNLRWDEHIMHDSNALIKQMSQRLSAMRQVCMFADFKSRTRARRTIGATVNKS